VDIWVLWVALPMFIVGLLAWSGGLPFMDRHT
jgi:hypothetical protein